MNFNSKIIKLFLQLYVPFLSGILLLGACKSNKQEIDKSIDIQSIAKEELGGVTSLVSNQNDTYTLAILDHKMKTRPDSRSFVIINKQGEIVHKKTKVNGTINWLDNTSLEVTTFPGVVKDEMDTLDKHSYIINLDKAEI